MAAVPSLPEEAIPSKIVNGTSHVNKLSNGTSSFQIHDHEIGQHRPMRVVVIGAGYAGVYCGIRIPERLKNVDLTIYEKNGGVGGTWYENRYPGAACDIASHSYQYSFNPNPKWSALYAPSWEIRDYIDETAKKYSVNRFVKLKHKVTECIYNGKKLKWELKVEDLGTGTTIEDTADIVINARGLLNDIKWPDIEGLNSFKGEKMHSAAWNESYDFKDKKVGIIGSGSSSIQIVPQLQKVPGAHLSVFVRNRTWISPSFGKQVFEKMGIEGFDFPEEYREKLANDPEAHYDLRIACDEDNNSVHRFTIGGTESQKQARAMFETSMKERLKERPDIFDSLIPSFAPGCRRLTPGPGYLEALTKPNVDFVTTPISHLEPEGMRMKDGTLHDLDVLVCATGFRTSAAPPFLVQNSDGLSLETHYERYPRTYISVGVDEFPNHFFMLGPNSGIGAGSLLIMLEAQGDYIIKCIRKMQKENIASMTPKKERVDDFVEYSKAYFPLTVYSDDCRTWYKNSYNEITGLWPGSTLHMLELFRSPRWEDYEYNYVEGNENKLAWLGNGWGPGQMENKHTAWYLYPEHVDDPVHPLPEEGGKYDTRLFSH